MSSTNKNISPRKAKAASNRLYSSIITTPCEKVLMILRQIKKFILNISKDQAKLIQNLDWCIKVITSRSLYSYELKEKDNINNLSKINPEFKQLVDFVSEYNEKVIKMNRQYDYILTDKLLQKSSTKLNRRRIERKSSYGVRDSKLFKLLQLEETNNKENKIEKKCNNNVRYKDWGINRKKVSRNSVFSPNLNLKEITTFLNDKYLRTEINPFDDVFIRKKMNPKRLRKQLININDDEKLLNNINNTNDSIGNITSPRLNQTNYIQHKSTNNESLKKVNNSNKTKLLNYTNRKTRNKMEIFPSIKTISISIKKGSTSNTQNIFPPKRFNSSNAASLGMIKSIGSSNSKFKKNCKSRKNISNTIKGYDFSKLQNKLIHEGYDISKSITEKNFNIFELKELIGYNNVLLIMGRVILENLGLLDEEILNSAKLDNFLTSVSNQYKQETLYHNALHGSDVTHSVYLFFTHSNAEKIAKTNVLDLLSIIIAALGHDIGHPGLTNTYQINDSTDMAIIYNDISVL